MFTPPAACVTHVHGTLRKGLTPTRGVVTALATGMPTQRVESGPDGSFSIALPSTGTLIFEAADCEPSAKRIFEHPRVQNAVGKLMASDDLARKLADELAPHVPAPARLSEVALTDGHGRRLAAMA